MHRFAALIPLALLVAGCSAGGAGGMATLGDTLTRAEMSALAVTNAFQAVERLRPHFLRTRGATSLRDPTPAPPRVYLDGVHVGDVDELRDIHVSDVDTIRYLDGPDATTRFGIGHVAGAILVRSRKGGD